jgi:two-component sensor histidine kinase
MTSSSIDLVPQGDRTGSWQFLLDAIERLSLARRMEDVIGVVRDNASILAGADGVCFVLRDGDFCHYVEENAIGPLWKGCKFPMSACISGWAMLNRATAISPDIYEDARIPHDAYRPTFVRSLVMVPVRRQDPLGAIGVYWSFCHKPGEDRIVRIEALARATATALENISLYASLQAELDRAHKHAAEMKRLLQEIDHRVKNTLAVVQSICLHSLRGAQSLEGFSEAFNGRIIGLSRAHDLLARNSWEGADLRALVEAVLEPGPARLKERFSCEGASMLLPPKATVSLGLALQELGANARRHGAWSGDRGKVELTWTVNGPQDGQPAALRLRWSEEGGPVVAAPSRRGFGTRLLTGIAQDPDAEVRLDYEPCGFCYSLSLPLRDMD